MSRGHLPHGFDQRDAPDDRTFWVDYRPRPPTWTDPRSDPDEPLPPGWEECISPDGTPFFIQKGPRITWEDPRAAPKEHGEFNTPSFDFPKSQDGIDEKLLGKRTRTSHVEYRLLMSMTRWRMAQVLTGYPDARTADVDAVISLLKMRIDSCPDDDLASLRPLEDGIIRKAYELISSNASVGQFSIPTVPRTKEEVEAGFVNTSWAIIRPMIFIILLGVPANYRRRLTKADWIQWASSKRWIDQQQAMDAFIKNLIAEWNLINLISILLLSSTVGFLSIQNLGRIPTTAVLISLTFSLGALVLSVSYIWRYQRQLSNMYDLRSVTNEFIYEAGDALLILLSLPVACLLWSLFFFTVGVLAFAWLCVPWWDSAIGPSVTVALIVSISSTTWVSHRYRALWKDLWRNWFAKEEVDDAQSGFSTLGNTVEDKA